MIIIMADSAGHHGMIADITMHFYAIDKVIKFEVTSRMIDIIAGPANHWHMIADSEHSMIIVKNSMIKGLDVDTIWSLKDFQK